MEKNAYKIQILQTNLEDLWANVQLVNPQVIYLKIPATATAKWLQSCPTVRPHRRQPTRLQRLWDSPGKNIRIIF